MHYAHVLKDINSGEPKFQTCADHSRETAGLAREILKKHGLADAGYLAGLLHDCGKFTDEFDNYLIKAANNEPVRKGSVIHTFAGVAYLLTSFHTKPPALTLEDLAAEVLAASIGGHHGLMDLWDERHQSGFEHRLTKQPDYDAQAIKAFQEECADAEEIRKLFAKAQREIIDFYQDRICSSVRGDKEGHFAFGLLVRLITSAVVSGDRTDTACFMQGLPLPKAEAISWGDCVQHTEAHLACFPCESPVQKARCVFSDACAEAAENQPGLYRLDLPTGGGKTLAALRFAARHAQKHGMRRVFYIAPLLSIIEQNAAVIRAAVGNALPVLEHHSNVVRDEASPEEANRAELLQETWDAPIIITTLVQLLETMFSGKMSAVRRFHCLCDSVIILDEVQSLPRKLLTLFNSTINFLTSCCGTTVVLCSATQPDFENKVIQHRMRPCKRLVGEDVFQQYAPLFRRTEIVDAGSVSMEEIVTVAEDMLSASDSLLIVCNTKREAAEMYQRIQAIPGIKRFHLSAGMCMANRKQMMAGLMEALEHHERLICISTQVIEAGIDVSFQAVIRLSAGLDNVVQTAGRCNRHGESPSPCPVRVYRLLGEKLGQLREIKEAQDALNALLADYRLKPEQYNRDLTSDAAVKAYYHFLYRDMPHGAQDYPVHGQTLFELLSTNFQFVDESKPAYLLNQAFRTAGSWFEVFDNASESVLVPFQEGKKLIASLESDRVRYDLRYTAELLTQAKQYAVSLPSSVIQRMMAGGMIYTLLEGAVYGLNEGFYDDEIGVKEGIDLCSTQIW